MKISYNWLKQYIALAASPEETAEMLTGCGLEVEAMETWSAVRGGLQGIVVGEVLEKAKHPNADKLSITKVSTGDGHTYQIVCGAPNVDAGQKVLVATIGSVLYPVTGEPFEIKKSKIRGEVSEGMICAEDEIGMGTSHAGIMVLPSAAVTGTSAADFFNMETDYVFEIGLTPNRADATSHLGVARDLAAIWNANRLVENKHTERLLLSKPDVTGFMPAEKDAIAVVVEDAVACPRYAGVYIKNVTVGESPAWLKNRLKALGLKPVNNIVDITNFVMLETGQPLHAFDGDKIAGNTIIVKKLPANTTFVTLDATERKLTGDELMICDDSKGLCMAGIYGGLESGISDQTKSIFLESAYFNPATIRKAARHHGLKTDASFRFERGADPEITTYALKRAVGLLTETCPHITYAGITDVYPHPFIPARVHINLKNLASLTGVIIPLPVIKEILSALEVKILNESPEALETEIPLFKPDVKRPADAAEEILRIYGYNRVPIPAKMNTNLPRFSRPDTQAMQMHLSAYLVSQGFNEIMGNSLTRLDFAELNGLPGEAIKMLNPLSSDLSILRQSLLFSGLEAIAYNKNRKNPDLRLFEFGKIYFRSRDAYKEENHLGVIMSGKRDKPNWIPQPQNYTVYYLKSMVQNLLLIAGISPVQKMEFKTEPHPLYTVCLSWYYKQKLLAQAGIIKKQVLHKFDMEGAVYCIDLFMDKVTGSVLLKDAMIGEAPRYPEVKRDLSMLLDKHVSFESIEKTALETERKLLRKIQLFDVYEGEKVEKGKKSYAVSFILRDDERTLEDRQIDGIMERLMKNFEQKLGAVIRKG